MSSRPDLTGYAPPSSRTPLGYSNYFARELHQESVTFSQTAYPHPPVDDRLDLLLRFLVFLGARNIEGIPGIYTLAPGAYHSCLGLLPSLDEPVFLEAMFSLRYEVYFDRSLILLRANSFHDTLIEDTSRLIRNRIAALRRSSDFFTRECLDGIYAHRNIKVHLENGHVLCPDEHYFIDGQTLPGLVIEATFSRSLECLAEKARIYLTSSGGSTQFVLGLTTSDEPLPYRLTLHCWALKATLGVSAMPGEDCWEKNFEGDVCVGSYIHQNTLKLPLKVFGRPDLISQRHPCVNLDENINISFTQLANCFFRTKSIHCGGMQLE